MGKIRDLPGMRSLRERSKKAGGGFLLLALVLWMLWGCGEERQQKPGSVEAGNKGKLEDAKEMEEIAVVWRSVSQEEYLQAAQQIVAELGRKGYIAVDRENQVNMTGAEQVERFCKAVEEGKITVLVVNFPDGLIKYDMSTENGQVDIVRDYYSWTDGELARKDTASYKAEVWKYTAEGYLVFAGNYPLESRYAMELADGRECAALRVQPLDERLRELNRKYILPVGYGINNLFLCDWSEENPDGLDFQDLFAKFYPRVYGRPVPYTPQENLGNNTVYRIPGEEFETVIGKYFQIDRETLREMTDYLAAEDAYEYRPRGFYETEYPEIPCPEVVGFSEQTDGTIALTVNAVYKEESTSRAFTHQVVIRPLEDGGFQYVSNRMLFWGNGHEMWWHTERLSREEWMEVYGNTGV